MVVKLTLLCKQKALYVKCCVIQNGVSDFHGDVLDATDIKKIFTSFNNQSSFEIYHNEIPVQEVSLLENYISQTEEQIGSTIIPSGSWMATIRVDNPAIKEKLLNGDFGGVSLNNRVQDSCATGLVGNITYSDLKDAECVIPVYISFVDEPANNVGLHIMDYNVYIQKSKNGGKEMSLIEDLKALISKAEEEAKEEVEDAETPADATEEEPVEEVKKEATEEEDDEVVEEEAVAEEEIEKDATEGEEATEETSEDPVIEKEAETDDASEDATEIQKEAEEIIEETDDDATVFDAEAEIIALKEQIAELKAIVEELMPPNPIDAEVEVEDNANEPIITKSAKIEVTSIDPLDEISDFYERTGRDKITGCKIKKHSKILN